VIIVVVVVMVGEGGDKSPMEEGPSWRLGILFFM